MSGSGNILCYPDTEQVGKSISEINISDEVKQAVQNGLTGDYIYEIDGTRYYGNLTEIDSAGWYVPVSYTHLDVYKRQLQGRAHRRPFYVPVQERTDSKLLPSQCPYDAEGISDGLQLRGDKAHR